MLVGKEYIFDSAHCIEGHAKCGEIHGHTWTLTVMVKGSIHDNGMVIDFNDLNEHVRPIVKDFDHKNINEVLIHDTDYNHLYQDINKSKPVTAETMARLFAYVIYRRLSTSLSIASITCRLQEGFGGWAESTYPGE